MAISLSLVMLGVVSLAPISSAKKRPAKAQISLSTSCKAKTGTFTTIQVEMDGALEQKSPYQMVITIGVEVRTLSHSYPNVLIVHD